MNKPVKQSTSKIRDKRAYDIAVTHTAKSSQDTERLQTIAELSLTIETKLRELEQGGFKNGICVSMCPTIFPAQIKQKEFVIWALAPKGWVYFMLSSCGRLLSMRTKPTPGYTKAYIFSNSDRPLLIYLKIEDLSTYRRNTIEEIIKTIQQLET